MSVDHCFWSSHSSSKGFSSTLLPSVAEKVWVKVTSADHEVVIDCIPSKADLSVYCAHVNCLEFVCRNHDSDYTGRYFYLLKIIESCR